MEKENQKQLTQILGIGRGLLNEGIASWAEIYREIGRLQERAEKPPVEKFTMPCNQKSNDVQNTHYHDGMPCPNNPCVWC